MASVELRGVSVVYPDLPPALDAVDLTVADGELVVVAGPSGSGKTTLLRVVAGLQDPSAGSVWIGGRDVTGEGTEARDVAMVFQEFALYPQRTASGNIEFPLEARRVKPESERKRRARAEARNLRIEHILGVKPGQLSAGHRQAVATARALVRESTALLMDEPLANLDAHLRAGGRVEVKRVQRDLGITVLYVTNDQVEAMALGDRIAVLDDGRLQQVGPPREVYDRPANTMVAGFLGQPPMNLIPGEVTVAGGRFEVALGDDRLGLDPDAAERFPGLPDLADFPLIVGIRPEHLRPAGGGTPFERTLHGVVLEVEDHGTGAVARVDLGGRGLEVAVAVPPGRLVPAEHIELEAAVERIRFFDAVTGTAVAGR